jgi:hypothetical protein
MKIVFAALLLAGVAIAQTTGVQATRLFSGSDGETHAEVIDLSKAVASQADLLKANGVRFATRGPGTSDEWHTAPQRQYLITLKGHAEIEIGGGKIVHSTPGTVLLIEDTTGKGHRAKVTADSEWHVMFVQVAK